VRRAWLVVVGLALLVGCGRPAPAAQGGESGLGATAAARGKAGPFVAVVDARGDQPGGRVHVVDVSSRKLVASIKREAPDGLFDPATGDLLVGTARGLERFRAGEWKVTGEPLPTAFHGWWKLLPEAPQYALNPDGRRLHFVAYHPDGPGPGGMGRLAVQTVDLQAGKVEGHIDIPPKGGRLVVPTADRGYLVHLDGSVTELLLDAGATGDTVAAAVGRRVAGEFWQGGRLLLVGSVGLVSAVQDGSATEVADLAFPAETAIPHRQVALSPNGAWLYVGVAEVARCETGCASDELVGARQADTVRVYRTESWELVAQYPVSHPFVGMAAVGAQLVLVSATDRTVAFVHPGTGKELALIKEVGRQPSLILGP
jgi:hypothetical protein